MSLIFPDDTTKRKLALNHRYGTRLRALPTGEVITEVWDVYRIIGIHHVLVYKGYANRNTAQQISDALAAKTGSKCYLVGRKSRSVRK